MYRLDGKVAFVTAADGYFAAKVGAVGLMNAHAGSIVRVAVRFDVEQQLGCRGGDRISMRALWGNRAPRGPVDCDRWYRCRQRLATARSGAAVTLGPRA